MVEGIIYRYWTGDRAAGPAGHARSVADGVKWHHRITADGTWDAVLSALTAHADQGGGGLVGVGGLSDRACATARDEHHPHHEGFVQRDEAPTRAA